MTFSVPAISNRTAANMTRPAPLTMLLPSLAGRHRRRPHDAPRGFAIEPCPPFRRKPAIMQVHGLRRIAVRPDHDPDQPLLREGAVGTGSCGGPVPRAP